MGKGEWHGVRSESLMGQIMPAVKAKLGDFALRDRGSCWRVLGSRAGICHSGWPACQSSSYFGNHESNGRQGPSSRCGSQGLEGMRMSLLIFRTRPIWCCSVGLWISKRQGQLEIIRAATVQSGVHMGACAGAGGSSIWWSMAVAPGCPKHPVQRNRAASSANHSRSFTVQAFLCTLVSSLPLDSLEFPSQFQ